jgi:hypothetical protein
MATGAAFGNLAWLARSAKRSSTQARHFIPLGLLVSGYAGKDCIIGFDGRRTITRLAHF